MHSIQSFLRKIAAGPVKVMNAFSINMLPEALTEGRKKHTVTFEPISTQEAKDVVKSAAIESYIGHEDTAAVLSDLLEEQIPFHRGFAKIGIGDTVLVAQLGTRLPEGSKTLPKGAKLNFWLIELK